MKLTLEELFKIEHELLTEQYDEETMAIIVEFMKRILEKEENKK